MSRPAPAVAVVGLGFGRAHVPAGTTKPTDAEDFVALVRELTSGAQVPPALSA